MPLRQVLRQFSGCTPHSPGYEFRAHQAEFPVRRPFLVVLAGADIGAFASRSEGRLCSEATTHGGISTTNVLLKNSFSGEFTLRSDHLICISSRVSAGSPRPGIAFTKGKIL